METTETTTTPEPETTHAPESQEPTRTGETQVPDPSPEPAPVQTQEPVTQPSEQPEQQPPTIQKAEDYTLPEGMPKQMADFALAQGLTQQQLDASIQQFGAFNQASETIRQQQLRQQGEEHVKNWGDQGDYKLSLARRALAQNDPEGSLTNLLNETGFGNHPVVLDFLHTIGNFMQEGGFLKSAQTAGESKKTVAQAMYPDLPSKEK